MRLLLTAVLAIVLLGTIAGQKPARDGAANSTYTRDPILTGERTKTLPPAWDTLRTDTIDGVALYVADWDHAGLAWAVAKALVQVRRPIGYRGYTVPEDFIFTETVGYLVRKENDINNPGQPYSPFVWEERKPEAVQLFFERPLPDETDPKLQREEKREK